MIQIKHDVTDDYVLESLTAYQSYNERHLYEMAIIMLDQANCIMEALLPVTEAEVVKNDSAVKAVSAGGKVVNSVKNIITKMLDFVKNIFGRFKDFIQTAFQNNEKWLSEREKDFSSMNYKGLGIAMVPYWLGKIDTMSNEIAKVVIRSTDRALYAAVSGNPDEASKFASEDGMGNVLQKYEGKSGLTDGIKNLLRVNNKDGVDEVQLHEDELKGKIVSEFIPFVKNFNKYIENVNKDIRDCESYSNKIVSEINRRGVKESFIEGIPLSNTDLVFTESYHTVMEAEEVAKEEKKDDNPSVKDSTTGSTKVKMLAKESESDRQDKEQIKGFNDLELKVMRQYTKMMQLLLASTMTVYEERYTAYFNAIKAVYKEANTRHGRKGNTFGQEDEKKK